MHDLANKQPSKKEMQGFWKLIVVQMQNALNEKAAQFLLIPLAAALPAGWLTGPQGLMENLLGAMVVLPFVLFAPLVGWIADCFSKARIIQSMVLLQGVVLVAMWLSLHNQSLNWALVFFAVFALQATVLSPAKKGIVKDIVGGNKIGSASGILEMSVILAILVGQIGAFVWFNYLYTSTNKIWDSAAFPSLLLALTVLPGVLLSLGIPSYKPLQKTPYRHSLWYEHFSQLADIWSQRKLRLSVSGVSYFWFFGGFLTLLLIQITKESGVANFGYAAALMMAWMSGGVVMGGLIASLLCRNKIELGLIPLGVSGMAASCFVLACLPTQGMLFNIFLALSGFFGAGFLVPINAYLVNSCEDAKRGTVIAGGNLADCLSGLLAVALQALLRQWLSIGWQFAFLGFAGLVVTIVALRLVPQDFVRMLGLWTVGLFYRVRVHNAGNLPREGGVLLLANHLTWIDAFLLSLSCKRPVRFMVAAEFTQVKKIAWFLELFDCVPVSLDNPRDSIRRASKILQEGQVVCIFGEGQLSRHGGLNRLQRGFEMIARNSSAAVVCVYMDGLWGSWWSYAGNRFFYSPHKLSVPYNFSVALSAPAHKLDVTQAWQSLQQLCAQCLSANCNDIKNRLLLQAGKYPRKVLWQDGEHAVNLRQWQQALGSTAVPQHASASLAAALTAMQKLWQDPQALQAAAVNILQLLRVNSLGNYSKLVVLEEDELKQAGWLLLWPLLAKSSIVIASRQQVLQQLQSLAAQNVALLCSKSAFDSKLQQALAELSANTTAQLHCYVGQLSASEAHLAQGLRSMWLAQGSVLAISMQHETYRVDENSSQTGIKPQSLGMLLPGNYIKDKRLYLAWGSSQAWPECYELDEDYFVMPAADYKQLCDQTS